MRVNTSKRIELLDITDMVASEVRSSGIQDGVCVIRTSHTTTSVVINENESGLVSDILSMVEKLIPSCAGYRHDRIDNNADAHLRSVLLGNSEIVPVREGKLFLGTWQSIFLVELDGPRKRTVDVIIIPVEVDCSESEKDISMH